MKKRDYSGSALYSIKTLKNNLVLYVPDLLFFTFTLVLSFAFLYFNNLTSVLSGGLFSIQDKVLDTLASGPSLFKFIISLIVFGIINILVGVSIVTVRFIMITKVINNKRFGFYDIWREDKKYVFSLVGLKIILFFIYLIPTVILLGIGLLYKELFLVMLLFMVVAFIIIRFVFLFSYPILFLENERNPFKIIKKSSDYFDTNKKHTIITGIIIILTTVIINGASNFSILSSVNWGLYLSSGLILMPIIYLIIRTLVDISVNLWSILFIFKNYQTLTSKKS